MGNEFLPLLYSFHFYLFGLIAIAGAIAFVTRKSPIAAAMWLVVTMFALAALYVMMDAFRDYLLAFELTSILLLIAIAGAVVLGRKRSAN